MLKVIAPYVLLKVRDQAGAWVVGGFYAGALLKTHDVEPESAQHHLRKGMVVEEVDDVVLPTEPEQQESQTEDDADLPPLAPAAARPAPNANKAEWVAYAVALRPEGVSEEDARAEAEAMKKDDLIAMYGNGN
jgi:hypothetical protein